MTNSMSIDVLRGVLKCDPDTGYLEWLPRPRDMFTCARSFSTWNARFAGCPALTATQAGGYKAGIILNRKYLAHRVVWALHFGEWPGQLLDHINGNPRDNRICNLREVTYVENAQNQRLSAANKSGFTGVSWHKQNRRWTATIRVNGKMIHLGIFDAIEDAISARVAASVKYGFHENHGRAA